LPLQPRDRMEPRHPFAIRWHAVVARRVETPFRWVPLPGLLAHQVQSRQPHPLGKLSPEVREASKVWNGAGLEHIEQRPAADSKISLIIECAENSVKVSRVVLVARISLLDENALRVAVPDARPGLIGPAEAEREVRLSALEHLIEGAVDDPAAG